MRSFTVLILLAALTGCESDKQAFVEEQVLLTSEAPATAPETASLQGLDRAHWAKQEIRAVQGSVPHHPHYFHREFFGATWYPKAERPSPLYRQDPDSLKSLNAALDNDREAFDTGDLLEMGLDPLKFGLDLGTLPARAAVVEQPWDIQSK